MHLFIEKGLTGGISYFYKWYIEANNKYIKNYNPTKPSKSISTLIWISCTVGEWVVILLMVDLSG